MWNVVEDSRPVPPLADHHRYLCLIARGDERREVYVEVTGTAACSAPDTLPDPIGEMVRTHGRAAVERYLSDDEPPIRITVDTRSWRPIYRDLIEAT